MTAKTKKRPILNRVTFATSRSMDFFSENELKTQTGHPIEEWPCVILKETIDNALDACEETDIPPVITVKADATGIVVSDNGPGVPESTIQGATDFTVRVSNREQYVAPDREAQGNALMTLLSMPFVLSPQNGKMVITSRGIRHEIVCRADPVTQQVHVEDKTTNVPERQGTEVSMTWPADEDDSGAIWPFGEDCYPTHDGSIRQCSVKETCQALIQGYALFNPHLTITCDWFGETTTMKATNTSWSKWKPNKPTSPRWYQLRHLERLIAGYIGHDREHGTDRTVATFIAEFDGLSASKKRKTVLEDVGLSRQKLSELATDEGLNSDLIDSLLESMKRHTAAVGVKRLGIIGRDHFVTRLTEWGCDEDQVEYSKTARVDDGIPFVLESVFGWLGEDAPNRRQIFAGANWSPGIKNPFRSFGQTGAGLEAALQEQRVGAREPVIFALHLAHPRVEYTDRGKSAIVIGGN